VTSPWDGFYYQMAGLSAGAQGTTAPEWASPTFDYYGFSVVPQWNTDFRQWGFWLYGIWVPLPNQPSSGG
jgi:hypothetical protein